MHSSARGRGCNSPGLLTVRRETKLMIFSFFEDPLLRRRIDDEGRPLEIGVQTQVSNRPVPL
jgi:hypothetical protein